MNKRTSHLLFGLIGMILAVLLLGGCSHALPRNISTSASASYEEVTAAASPILSPSPSPSPSEPGFAATVMPSPAETTPQPTRGSVDPSELVVTFIDVGKADSILVQQGNASMLIDAGTPEMTQTVVDKLHQSGVDSLDLLVLTHSDKDHAGGMAGVLEEFPVKKILLPPAAKMDKPFGYMLQVMNDKGLPNESPKPNSKMFLGSANLTFFGPIHPPYQDNNNNSLVFRLQFGQISFLFEGDALRQSEIDMLSRHYSMASTVLKVSHHGADDTSSLRFLKAVKPQYAVISDSEYGDTSKNVLSRLAQVHAKVYSTAYSGTIVATTDGKKITFNCTPLSLGSP